MRFLCRLTAWLTAQAKNVLGIIACIVLAIVAIALDNLYDFWDDVKDDLEKYAARTALALLIWIIGFAEIVHGQAAIGYFFLLLGIIPGFPLLRFVFVSFVQISRERMRWHYLDKGW